jgi:hypothetical protein
MSFSITALADQISNRLLGQLLRGHLTRVDAMLVEAECHKIDGLDQPEYHHLHALVMRQITPPAVPYRRRPRRWPLTATAMTVLLGVFPLTGAFAQEGQQVFEFQWNDIIECAHIDIGDEPPMPKVGRDVTQWLADERGRARRASEILACQQLLAARHDGWAGAKAGQPDLFDPDHERAPQQ